MRRTNKFIMMICGMWLFSIITTGQVFTQKYRGFLGDDAVVFTLTFDRATGKINGNYTKSNDGLKRIVIGEFDKVKEENPKVPPRTPTPTPYPPKPLNPNEPKPTKVNTTNVFTLKELNPKTNKPTGEIQLNLSGEMNGDWTFKTGKPAIELVLKIEADSKAETYKITEKSFSEKTGKLEISLIYPQIVGENEESVKAFNQFIEKKMLAKNEVSRKNTAENYDDQHALWKVKFLYRSNFQTVLATDRILSLSIFTDEGMGSKEGNGYNEDEEFIINFDLKNRREISFAELFEADSDYLKVFSEACLEKFKGSKRKIDWRPIYEPIPLNFCQPEPENFSRWLITDTGLYFQLKPERGIEKPRLTINFDKIETLGGKLRKAGVLSELLETYYRQLK